jgi:TP901 family phage tail tape measure protein
MAISETITVDAGEAIDSLNELAAAAEDVAGKFAGLDGTLKAGFAGAGAGPDKMIAAWDKAATSVSASVDKIGASIGKLDELGALAGAAGPADLVAKWDTAAAGVAASIDKIAASAGKLDDIGAGAGAAADEVKGLGAAGDAAAGGLGRAADAAKGLSDSTGGLSGLGDGLKGLGGDADALAAEIAAAGAEMDKLLAKGDALSARGAVSGASAASLNAKVDSSGYLATASVEQDAAKTQASAQAKADAAAAEASAGKYHMLALGGAAALAYGVDLAAKLQTSVTRLYTTAGESAANLPMMSQGILKLSGETNTSQAALGQGAYMIESAGYHGQNALGVLKAAAEGAQAEGAPLGDTANALTSLMNAYGVPKGQSASKGAMTDMDQIIAMVSRGKMTMAGAVGALPDVLPAASAAKLSFSQVGGALSTMTAMGVSPERAAQNLSHVITSIENPNSVQTKEMQQLGLNPVSIENQLGKKGLTGTFEELSSTVMKSMGPAGDVLFKTFNQSKSAAADATTMISAMPASIRNTAQAYADGKTTAKEWNAEVYSGSESAKNKNLLQQFATVENTASGFNDLLKSGSPAAQTYAAAMSKLTGGQTGLNVAMELTNGHAATFKSNTDAIADAAQHAGANVTGWSKVQSTLNFQLGSFDKTAQAVATQAGQVALPALTGLMHGLSDVGGFLASNPGLTKPLVEGAGVLGAVTVAGKVASAGATAASSVGKIAETLHIPGLSNLANIGKSAGLDTAAGSLDTAGAGLKGAAADLSAAAEKLSTGEPSGNPLGTTPGKTTPESDAENGAENAAEGVGGASLFTKVAGAGGMDTAGLASAANPIIAGVLAGMIIRGEGDSLAPKGTPAGKLNQYLQSPQAPGNYDVNRETGGYESALAMSSVGLSIGKAISEALFGVSKAPAIASAQQGQFESRFGIPEPGNKSPVFSAPATPLAATPAKYQNITDTIGIAEAETVPAKAAAPSESFSAALAQAMGKPVKVPPPDLSSFTGKAQQAGQQFDSMLAEALHKPVKVAPPDLSPFTAAKGPARADGVGVSAGFAQGIEAGKSAAVAAAASVAAAATAAMKTSLDSHSPSKVTEKIGKDTVAGLVLGLEGGQGSVSAAAADLAKAATTPWTNGTTTATYKALAADVASAFKAGDITKSQDSAAVAFLKSDTAKMQGLEHQRATIEANIKAADAYASNVQSSAISNASIVNVAGNIQSADTSTSAPAPAAQYQASDLISGEQAQLQQIKAFNSAIGQDKKMGLNTTELGQIIQSGASTGLPIAQAIASGGKGAVAQLNALQSQMNAAAKQLGVTSANSMYESGSQIGAGLAAGMKGELSSVVGAIDHMATEMVDELKKDLKISSPSQVFADLAEMVPAGAAMGVNRGTPMAAAAVGRMGSAMAGGYHAPSFGAYGHGGGSGGGSGGSGGGGTTIINNHYDINIQGSVASEDQLLTRFQQGLLTKASNNWQAGVILPGRAG